MLTTAWGLSSPPGSSPDEDFHAASIACAAGDSKFCEVLETNQSGKPVKAKVPERIESVCYYTAFPAQDASCIYEQLDRSAETSRLNQSLISGSFYSVMNTFMGDDYESSIRSMRIFNSAIFSLLLFLALVTVLPQVQRGITLMTMTAMVPFATFFIPSINLSSWTITGTLFTWIFLYSLASVIAQPHQLVRKLLLAAGLILSVTLALGSRGDSALYLSVAAISVVIVKWSKTGTALRWVLGLAAVAFFSVALFFQSARARNLSDVITENLQSPGKFLELTIELPTVIAGIIGSSAPTFNDNPFFYYGLGWHEVQMPTLVILITLFTLGGLIFALIPGARKATIFTTLFVVIMMIAIQMFAVASYSYSGEFIATPRYMTPLFLVSVVLFFSLVQTKSNFLSNAQLVWLFLAMPAASAIALLTTIRRYTVGQGETWFQLDFEPNWWWESFPLGPAGVWLLGVVGSFMVATAAILILRNRTSIRNTEWKEPRVTLESTIVKDPSPTKRFLQPRLLFLFAWVFSLISAWSLIRLPGEISPTANLFRGYFPNDQLSYAGIASSAKGGNFGLVEPFTQTGVSFYPSWWYKFVGQFASWTGMDVPAAWSFLGLSVILGAVAFIGFAAYRITGRVWAPVVIGVLLWIGPLSSIVFDNWFVNLNSHAVMWGPYGALYPLNAEAAGLSLGAAALVLGYWTLMRPNWTFKKRLLLLALSGLGLGIIANFQTYSFLTLTALTFWILAIAGLIHSRSRKYVIGTVLALVAILFIGPFIRESAGALPIYALMLIPTLPGLWLFAQKRIALVVVGLIFFVLGAAPQLLWMISGTLAQDPFLTYRVDQSAELSIPFWAFVLLGSPILATWAAILWAQINRKGTIEVGLLVGWFISFVLLSFNNLWGFGQEPYRFWINSVITFVVIAALTVPTALSQPGSSTRRIGALAVLAIVLVGASVWNVGGFRSYVSDTGNIDFETPRLQAIGEIVAADSLPTDLITAEPCIDPRILKVLTGSRVAFYNLGLAWPENKPAIDAVLDAGNAGVMDIDIMRNAGVTLLLTDSSCPTIWYPGGNMGTAQVGSVEYSDGQDIQRLDLWRIL